MAFLYFQDVVLRLFFHIPFLEKSRFLIKITNSEILESKGRDIVYAECQNYLSNINFDFLGLLGDRPLFSFCYPHNIFFELLISFGYFWGILFIALLFFLYFNAFARGYRTLCISLFMRYSVSGSYIIELNFWLFLFAIISICKCQNNTGA